MKTAMVLFAGVMIASTALVGQGDPMAEERYRMKYGRYTSAEEARQKLAREAERKDAVGYVGQACCRHMPHDTAFAVKPSANEAWFGAKFGRNTPAYEAGQKAAEVQVASHVARCAELGRCPLTLVSRAAESRITVARNLTETEARLQMKYGRALGAEVRRKTPAASEKEPLVAAAEPSRCTEACCKQGE